MKDKTPEERIIKAIEKWAKKERKNITWDAGPADSHTWGVVSGIDRTVEELKGIIKDGDY